MAHLFDNFPPEKDICMSLKPDEKVSINYVAWTAIISDIGSTNGWNETIIQQILSKAHSFFVCACKTISLDCNDVATLLSQIKKRFTIRTVANTIFVKTMRLVAQPASECKLVYLQQIWKIVNHLGILVIRFAGANSVSRLAAV